MTAEKYEKMLRMTDRQLVELCRSGRTEAADILLERYKPLVRKLSRARFIEGGDGDDLLQEGMIGLYRAVCDFDSSENTSFSTFAALCINRQMIRAMESARRKKHQMLNQAENLDAEGMNEPKTLPENDPERLVISQEDYDEKLRLLQDKLSPFEGKVLRLYLDGWEYREIAGILGKHPKSVDNAIQRIRQKAK